MQLNRNLNKPDVWQAFLRESKKQIEVDINEVERVIELAHHTPNLENHHNGLVSVSRFFSATMRELQHSQPEELADYQNFWVRYRDLVMQRHSGITPVEFRAADKITQQIFHRFLEKVPQKKYLYSRDAIPLVFGGVGGIDAYFTHPPSKERPIAIISLPNTIFDAVWQWLALAHEIGHDIYTTVIGLREEMENALANAMSHAVTNNQIDVPQMSHDLKYYDKPFQIRYSEHELLSTLWRAWANEAQADIIGLLNCGPAAAISLQQILGFEKKDYWQIHAGKDFIGNSPEVHPTTYIRHLFNLHALALMDSKFEPLIQQISQRIEALAPLGDDVVWKFPNDMEATRIKISELNKSASLAAKVILDTKFQALGNKSYRDLGSFTFEDQIIVEKMAKGLLVGDPYFSTINGDSPRHALAATVFALEAKPEQMDIINNTFKHFV